MSIIVEDGTGLSTANAFITLIFFKAYCDERGNDYSDYTDDELNEAIIRGNFFLSNSFNWAGYRVQGRDQALAFPRSGLVDHEDYAVPSDEVPTELQQATAECALREAATVGALTPDYTPSERLEAVKVGPLNVKYDMSRLDAESARPIMLIVRDLIGPFLTQGSGSRLQGEVTR